MMIYQNDDENSQISFSLLAVLDIVSLRLYN